MKDFTFWIVWSFAIAFSGCWMIFLMLTHTEIKSQITAALIMVADFTMFGIGLHISYIEKNNT